MFIDFISPVFFWNNGIFGILNGTTAIHGANGMLVVNIAKFWGATANKEKNEGSGAHLLLDLVVAQGIMVFGQQTENVDD